MQPVISVAHPDAPLGNGGKTIVLSAKRDEFVFLEDLWENITFEIMAGCHEIKVILRRGDNGEALPSSEEIVETIRLAFAEAPTPRGETRNDAYHILVTTRGDPLEDMEQHSILH